MGLATLSQLQAALADWLGRSDLTSAQLNDLMTMVENDVANGIYSAEGRCISDPIRVMEMQNVNSTFVLSGEYTNLPADWLGAISILYTSSNPVTPLDVESQAVIDGTWANVTSGTPKVCAVVGTQLRIRPAPANGDTATLTYFQRIPSLVLAGAGGTNWLQSRSPNLYLNGCLYHAKVFVGFPEEAGVFMQRYISDLNGLRASEEKNRFPGSSPVVRPYGVTIT